MTTASPKTSRKATSARTSDAAKPSPRAASSATAAAAVPADKKKATAAGRSGAAAKSEAKARPKSAGAKTGNAAADGSAGTVKSKKSGSKKPTLVRDSFTFPESDYALIAELKQRALKAGREIKKSEVLRAGLGVLAAMSDRALLIVLDAVERIKTGRPSK